MQLVSARQSVTLQEFAYNSPRSVTIEETPFRQVTSYHMKLFREELEPIHDRLERLEGSQTKNPEEDHAENGSDQTPNQRQNPRQGRVQQVDDNLTNIKIPIPYFQGRTDPDAYLAWEMIKVEHVFECYNYSEQKKVRLAAMEFIDYALLWWDQLLISRRCSGEGPVRDWAEMKRIMHRRFVPSHYHRDLFQRLQGLKQGSRSVEDYFKEMDVSMMRANIVEDREATMERFLSVELDEMVHMAIKVERRQRRKTTSSRGNTSFKHVSSTPFNSSNNFRKPAPQASLQIRERTETSKPKPPVVDVGRGKQSMHPTPQERSRDIQCFKCLGRGHVVNQCPNRRTTLLRDNGDIESELEEDEPIHLVEDTEDDDLEEPETGKIMELMVVKRSLNAQPVQNEQQQENIFHTRCNVLNKTGVFLEKEFLTNSGKGRNIELKEVQQQQDIEPEVEEISQVVEENPTDLETQPLRRSTRERHEPERYGFLVTTHGDIILVDQDESKTYQEAVASPDSEKWLEAMRSEMDSMSDNQVWTLVMIRSNLSKRSFFDCYGSRTVVEPPEGIKPIGCKWVFKKKTDMDGNVQTYKGRLVAKGFRQIHGVDYDETFSPVAMFKSIRILLAVAAFHDYEIWQMDVKTAFLNGKLEKDVYMTQPGGFVTPENARKVCKLQRSIYGLKQASRSWNLRFNEAIQEFGFIRNEDEPCVYKKFSGSIVSFLILYVDDILIIGNDIPTLQSIKTWLSSCFSMKDLGEAAYILGVKIYRDKSRRLLGLSQSTYIDKVLKRFSMEESKRGFLPMRHGISLSKEMCPSTPQERERMSQIPYASAIGSIMYAMICTRPDLSYALSMTSRYQANPGEGHWTAVKNILKYLRRTKDVFLVYRGEEELRIKGYTDASFQTDKDDSRSQSGFVFCLNKDTVS
ncbi:hypothetical protein GQ457_05G022260 [Hibiscus cannabinus]